MRYVEARFREYEREETYRIYVTKSLQLIPQSQYIQVTYREMLNPLQEQQNVDGDAIVADIMNRAGLKFGE